MAICDKCVKKSICKITCKEIVTGCIEYLQAHPLIDKTEAAEIRYQVKFLRMQANICKISGAFDSGKTLVEAADTIERLLSLLEEKKVE